MDGINVNGSNNIINVAGESISQEGTTINIQSGLPNHREKGSVSSLIDVGAGVERSELPDYHHWTCSIELKSKRFSAQHLYNTLLELNNTNLRKGILSILHREYRIHATAKEILFREVLHDANAVNHFRESALCIKPNSLQFEFAQYKKGSDLLTNMTDDLFPSLLILLMCRKLFDKSDVNVEVSTQISTNAKVIFMPVHGNPLSTIRSHYSTYIISDSSHESHFCFDSLNNDAIIDFLQETIDGFAADSPHSDHPFLTIDKAEQLMVLEHLAKN